MIIKYKMKESWKEKRNRSEKGIIKTKWKYKTKRVAAKDEKYN